MIDTNQNGIKKPKIVYLTHVSACWQFGVRGLADLHWPWLGVPALSYGFSWAWIFAGIRFGLRPKQMEKWPPGESSSNGEVAT